MTGRLKSFFANHKFISTCAVLLLLGLGYYLFVSLTGLTLFCPFQKLTGLACPGCGVSHLCMDLLELKFADAFRENPVIFVLAPVWAAALAVTAVIKKGSCVTRTPAINILAYVSVGVLIVFGVIRNLPGFEYLLPSYMR